MPRTKATKIAAFNALTQAAFHHEPRPPSVPPEHGHQRLFKGPAALPKRLPLGGEGLYIGSANALVWRSALADVAYLDIEVDGGACVSRMNLKATAGELRELAARLIDAAHDLELWPAERLAAYDSLTEQVPA